MGDLFLLSERQMARIEPYFALSHGVPRVDGRRVVGGIVYVIRNGLQWKDAPNDYGPHKTLYNRFIRWNRLGVFDRIFAGLSREGPRPERIMIDATHLKAHRTAASLLKKGLFLVVSGAQRWSELRAPHCLRRRGPADRHGFVRGPESDHKGASLVLDTLPPARTLIADRGYDSAGFRQALAAKGIAPCIPSSRSRKVPFAYDKLLYRQRHRIENLFAKLKDWRRIATRYDQCAHTFFSAICIAATVIFWLKGQ